MKATKLYGFGPRKSKGGFTLIELLIVMVILAILAGVVVMAVGGVFSTSKERAYEVARDEIKNAVAQYASDNSGGLPWITNSSSPTINCSGTLYGVINGSKLLIANQGILASLPASMDESGANDNCGSGTCPGGSYTWGMDTYGNVYSQCTEATSDCLSRTADGFQGVYP